MNCTVVILDLDGFDPRSRQIVEVAGLSVTDDAGIVDEWAETVVARPHSPWWNDACAEPVPFADVAPSLVDRLTRRPVAGVNIPYDIAILDEELSRVGIVLPSVAVIDVLEVAQVLGSLVSMRSLVLLCRAFDVPCQRLDSALGHARSTAALLRRLEGLLEERHGMCINRFARGR